MARVGVRRLAYPRHGQKTVADRVERRVPLTILVTGATDGLGRGVAAQLAADGARVLVHGRSPARIDDTIEEIRRTTGNDSSRGHLADLASFAEVRRLANDVRANETRLDVLINNAGIGRGPTGGQHREESADGHELRFAVNYLAPYLLTRLLVPLLEASAPARVVNVASIGQSPVDFDDVMQRTRYDAARAYSQSKLALIMFSIELAARLGHNGAVTVNSLHPGTLMPTKIVHEAWSQTIDTLDSGIAAVTRLATEPALDGVTGRYFDGQTESKALGQAYEPDARQRLWSLSADLVNLPS
jgi:NAD(P)-dependent dehydrogenase (short-subunit alcohol dehydrogenase family)